MSTRRSGLWLAFAAVAGLGLMTLGCEVRSFRLQIRGFDTFAVKGVRVYRLSPKTRRYERFAKIKFTERVRSGGSEIQRYEVTSSLGSVTLQSKITRPPEAIGDVRLDLAFPQVASNQPSRFKFTSYNALGESPLSAGALLR
jgi:hypothetical protein